MTWPRPSGNDNALPRFHDVEFLARGPGDTDVMSIDGGTGDGLGAVTDGEVLDDELGRGFSLGEVDLGTLKCHGAGSPWVWCLVG